MKGRLFFVCLCILLGVSRAAVGWASSEADARSAIAEAEQRVSSCYAAVAEAEKAGANVTGLLSVLEEAGMLLSKAHLAFQVRDFDSAYNVAVQSKTRLDGFDSQASSLKDTATHQRYLDFMINVVGSTGGTVAVVLGGFAVWLLLRRKYKPTGEVAG